MFGELERLARDALSYLRGSFNLSLPRRILQREIHFFTMCILQKVIRGLNSMDIDASLLRIFSCEMARDRKSVV